MESTQQTPQQVFAWRLDPKQAKQSIYLKQKCIERIDINKVYGFINEKMGIDYTDKRHNGFESELKQITNYKCRYSKKVSGFMIQHTLAKHKWGRLTTKGYSSISTFHRPTRILRGRIQGLGYEERSTNDDYTDCPTPRY